MLIVTTESNSPLQGSWTHSATTSSRPCRVAPTFSDRNLTALFTLDHPHPVPTATLTAQASCKDQDTRGSVLPPMGQSPLATCRPSILAPAHPAPSSAPLPQPLDHPLLTRVRAAVSLVIFSTAMDPTTPATAASMDTLKETILLCTASTRIRTFIIITSCLRRCLLTSTCILRSSGRLLAGNPRDPRVVMATAATRAV